MSTTPSLLTVEEFMKLPQPEEARLELIDGEVIHMAGGRPIHERTKSNLTMSLAAWLAQHPIGILLVESGYHLGEHNFPIPDLSVVLNERLKPASEGMVDGAPDLAVEVVSSEAASDLQKKIRLYLRFGAKSVWTVFPAERFVIIDRANGQMARLFEDQLLEDPAVLPGFSIPVSAVFAGL